MKHSSPLTFSSSAVPQRPSFFSAGSVSVTRRLDSSRGGVRATQRSWVSSSLQHDSLGDYTAGETALDETQASFLLQDEELRQSTERQAKRIRQLQARETRQRSVVAEEATQQFENLLALHATYAAIAETCLSLRDARAAAQQHHAEQSQQWSLQLLADTRRDVVRNERIARQAIAHAEAAVRETMRQLQGAAARGLDLHEGVFRLIHAEQVRRAFLLREEARGVEEMGIPGFISLPCAPSSTTAATSSSWCRSGARALRGVDKMDLMADQRCPFVCAADCPYMPQRTRQLGKAWADGRTEAAGEKSRIVSASTNQQQQRQQRGVSEVGKQRVRYAMAKQHLRETSSFLPSLRVGT